MSDALGSRKCIVPFAALMLLYAGLVPTTGRSQVESRATPAKVAAALPELERLARKYVTDGEVPGLSMAIVYQDKVVYLKGFGLKKAGETSLVDENTVFQIASMSKPVSATIVSALVSQGTASWDSRISDLDPDFQLLDPFASRNVTVRDLFSHRSGLPGNAGNELESMGYSRAEILHRLRYVEPESSFRSGYSYSNFGLTEAAVAAAKPTGQAWEDVAENLLYKPLGMTSTSSRYSDFLGRSNRATLHSPAAGKWAALAIREPDAQAPAGGVSSSARDLAEWMRLELGRGKYNGQQLIAESALAQTHLPMITRGTDNITGRPSFYGLGWGIDYETDGTIRWNHAGAFSHGARSYVSLNAADQLGIVVLANAFPSGVPEALGASMFDLVYEGKVQRDWLATWNGLYNSAFGPELIASIAAQYAVKPASPSPALKPEAYVGNYSTPYADARVLVENQSLVLKLGPGGMAYPLTHYDRDRFIYFPSAETPTLPSAVNFMIGLDGKASHLLLDDLAAQKQDVLPLVRSPEITAQPVSQRASAGSNIVLAVAARGTGSLTYQWRKAGVPIAGATSAVLSLNNITISDAAAYTVTVTEGGSSVTSAAANLTLVTGAVSKLKGLSVRAALAANQRLIIGLAVSGGFRPVFVQAAGPALSAVNVGGFLPDPRLEIFNGPGLRLAENDDWLDTVAATRAAVGAFPVGSSRKDAAVVALLAGNSTVQVFGAGSGLVFVEAYDAGAGDAQRVYAVSARNRVGTGDNVLTVGIRIEGSTNRNVLVRGIGPRLADFGVSGVLADPKLEIYDSKNVRIAENDNWSAALASAIAGTGLPLVAGSKDAALALSLAPGSYTVQVSGVGATTGEALVDIFEQP